MSDKDKPVKKPVKKKSGLVVSAEGGRVVLSRWPVTAEEKAEVEAKRKG